MKTVLRTLLIVSLTGLVAGTFYFLYQRSRPKLVVYKTVLVREMDIVKKTVASGSVVARKEIEIKPQLSGIIDELPAEAGDNVKKGGIIARIKLIPNLLRLNDAEARVKKAEVNLDYVKKTYNRVKKRYQEAILSGKISEKRDSPNLIKLNQAESELKTAKLNLSSAQKDFDRHKKLFKKQITTAAVFEETTLVLERAREVCNKALSNYQMMKAHTFDAAEAELQEAENSVKQAKEELSSSRNNLKLILDGISPLSPEKSNTLVRSTIDGMILDIPVKEGSPVMEINTQSMGTTIAIIADMNDMIFEGLVDESEINKINVGMEIILTIGAIADAKFNAIIEYIAPKGIEKNGAVQFNIRAKVKTNDQYFIRAGYSAGADIVLDKRENVLAVEEGNLIFKDSGVYAEVETKTGIFEKRKIMVGLSDGIHIEVLSGLTQEDKIKVQQ
ncbi:MAG: HlyD family efflux transporter periplasmic adaptor subunit [Desulfobacterales bacterium]|nr:HlyD family efflux transporter periplasmic adaptor subunit [Desulfobacterales bacterium]